MKSHYSIHLLCANLDVSPSGYYEWLKRRDCPGPRDLENQFLATRITQIHSQSRQTYGSPRLVEELRKEGRRHGRNRVARLMKQAGLNGRQKGAIAFKPPTATTTSLSRQITWQWLQPQPLPTRSGQVTSPTLKPRKAGFIWLESLIFTAARSSVGP